MTKQVLRKELLRRRRHLSPRYSRELSRCAQQRLIDSPEFSAAKRVALYAPIHNEVGTELLYQAARRTDKRICYPRVAGDDLAFYAVLQISELQPGAFGVATPEADPDRQVAAADIDLLVVPGVAFDMRGYRLGYGRGYYDRCLALLSTATVVGLCYEFQLQPELPVEPHDHPVGALATEARYIPCRH